MTTPASSTLTTKERSGSGRWQNPAVGVTLAFTFIVLLASLYLVYRLRRKRGPVWASKCPPITPRQPGHAKASTRSDDESMESVRSTEEPAKQDNGQPVVKKLPGPTQVKTTVSSSAASGEIMVSTLSKAPAKLESKLMITTQVSKTPLKTPLKAPLKAPLKKMPV